MVADVENVSPIEPKTAIGVDVGLKSLVALSTGEAVEYPRYCVQAENKLAVTQRNLSRKKKGSANRLKAKAKVAKISNRIQNLRDEFHHQVSRKLVDSADMKTGKVVELVDARYTSQKCSQYGIMVPKTLADRTHLCPNCGLENDRDLNASFNL